MPSIHCQYFGCFVLLIFWTLSSLHAAVIPVNNNDTRIKVASFNNNTQRQQHDLLPVADQVLIPQPIIPQNSNQSVEIVEQNIQVPLKNDHKKPASQSNERPLENAKGRAALSRDHLPRAVDDTKIDIVKDDRPINPRFPSAPENGAVVNVKQPSVDAVPAKLMHKPQIEKHVQLKLTDLQPPDHLDAVRMEQDGHLNRDYKKEIFFGEHEEIENSNPAEAKAMLTKIFSLADSNDDGYLDQTELQLWIQKKVSEHFEMAQKDNERIFQLLDSDGDGFITWDEFHIEFLKAKGHDEEMAKKHVSDYDVIPLDLADKDRLIRFKFLWAEADDEPKDNKLTLEEFRCFRHPEQSSAMISRMVQDIIDNLDKDQDGFIVEAEFVMLPAGHEDGVIHEDDRKWTEERRMEFRTVIDKDRDGKVGRDELKNYVDPQNPNHARIEADSLIHLGDDDKDGRLSLSEVLDNMDVFLGSKMVDTGRSFHDEF